MAIVPLVSSEHMMPGRIFVRQRSPLEGMYMVGRGRVLLQTENEDEENDVRFAGGFFGEDALLNSGTLSKWTAMAGDWSELLLLRGDDFRALGRAEPELKQKVAFLTRGKHTHTVDVLGAHERQLREQEEGLRNAGHFHMHLPHGLPHGHHSAHHSPAKGHGAGLSV